MARTFSCDHKLLDALLKYYKLEKDKDLAPLFNVKSPALSKIRLGINRVSPEMILKVHKMTKWPIDRIEFLAGHENKH